MIRQFKDGDIESVVSVWREASDYAHPFLLKEFQDKESENVRNIYPKYAKIWVKIFDTEVVGFVAMIDAEVGAIFVLPKFHGQGFGRELMDFVVNLTGSVTLDVFKLNVVGRRFYEKYGFKITDEYLHEPTNQWTLKLEYIPL